MSDAEPKGPYVYQPYGMQNPDHWASKRIFGIGGLPYLATVKGLTREEADAVLSALTQGQHQ